MRQTWEEIGLDLAEKDFICVGQLDDREITTSLGKRLLMILSPFGKLFRENLLFRRSDYCCFQCSFRSLRALYQLILLPKQQYIGCRSQD